jgi:hypothetical protein
MASPEAPLTPAARFGDGSAPITVTCYPHAQSDNRKGISIYQSGLDENNRNCPQRAKHHYYDYF